MGQLRWTYLDDDGRQYSVGLYHGENSGHFMLYVDASPVIIDFSVEESKQYSIFIGEELCDIILEKKNGNFAYGLIPNTHADTDLNRKRKSAAFADNIKTAGMAFLLVLVIVSINVFITGCK